MSNSNPPDCDDLIENSVLTVAQAREKILQTSTAVARQQSIDIKSASKRVLVSDIRSAVNVPNHTNSAMDGYALAGARLPDSGSKIFQLSGKSLAGSAYQEAVPSDSCVRITTGAVMPSGTDTVVMQEHVTLVADDQIEIDARNRAGQHVRLAGNDIEKDSVVLQEGRRLNAADMGVLASIGQVAVDVYEKPKVSFFSSGDELKPLGQDLAHGEIYNSSLYSISALIEQAGGEITHSEILPDQRSVIREALANAALTSDIIITTGGVSVGEADYIKEILSELGEVGFWKIAMKPGRPLAFGKIGQSLFFGLPGNPVSSMATFMQLVRPAMHKIAGIRPLPEPLRLKAQLQDKIRKRPGRMDFQRGVLEYKDGHYHVSSTGTQSSGQLRSMSIANCFIVLELDDNDIEAGTMVLVEPFSLEL